MRNTKNFFLWILFFGFGTIVAVVEPCIAEEVLYDSHGKRDPFSPLVTSTIKQAPGLLGIETVEDVILEGIIYDPKKGSVVILNGSVLKEGEEFANLKVLAVKPDGVALSVNGVESFKTVYQSETAPEKAHK